MNVVVAARPTRRSVNLSLLYPFALVRLARSHCTEIVLAPAASAWLAGAQESRRPATLGRRGLGYRRRQRRRPDDLEPHPRKDVVSREGRPGGRVAGKWERRRWRRTDRPTRRQEDAVIAADDDRSAVDRRQPATPKNLPARIKRDDVTARYLYLIAPPRTMIKNQRRLKIKYHHSLKIADVDIGDNRYDAYRLLGIR